MRTLRRHPPRLPQRKCKIAPYRRLAAREDMPLAVQMLEASRRLSWSRCRLSSEGGNEDSSSSCSQGSRPKGSTKAYSRLRKETIGTKSNKVLKQRWHRVEGRHRSSRRRRSLRAPSEMSCPSTSGKRPQRRLAHSNCSHSSASHLRSKSRLPPRKKLSTQMKTNPNGSRLPVGKVAVSMPT